MTTWPEFHMSAARLIATKSKDPSTKVGAVIVRPDQTQASWGYNGFPRGVKDSPERYADREMKLAMVVHAEVNSVINAREPLHGYKMFCTMHPCARCAAVIVQAGISCVAVPDDDIPERWKDEINIAKTILREGGVNLVREGKDRDGAAGRWQACTRGPLIG